MTRTDRRPTNGFLRPCKRRRRAGFTLVELLVCLSILAITAAIAVPAYTSKVRQGHQAEAERILTALAQAEEIYRYQNGSYAPVPPIAPLTALGWVNDSGPSVANPYYPTGNITVVTGINPPNAPPNGTGALGPWFVATAKGNIGGAVEDQWTVDNNGTLINTVPGF
jgi:prepilin-type N-terminal cleavage/methylation domain-containing protein